MLWSNLLHFSCKVLLFSKPTFLETLSVTCGRMCESAWASITKYNRWSGLYNFSLFFPVLIAGNSNIKVSSSSVLVMAFFTSGYLHCVYLHNDLLSSPKWKKKQTFMSLHLRALILSGATAIWPHLIPNTHTWFLLQTPAHYTVTASICAGEGAAQVFSS